MTEKIHPQSQVLIDELRKNGVKNPEETLLENLAAQYLSGKIDLAT